MRLIGGFSLGRWFGFEIRIDYSWFLIFFLVVWTLSSAEFPRQLPGATLPVYYVMGTVAALLLFLSVLLHELSHSVVARSRGLEVEGITLFIFGGVAQTRMEAKTAADEFLLTIAGPLSSVGIGGVFWLLALLVDFLGGPLTLITVARTLAIVNVALAVFNMIPGFPLDGGRIFRSAVWHFTGDVGKATRWASRAGQAFGYLLVGLGLFYLWQGYMLNGLWAAFIGWFLSSAASSSWRQFRARQLLAHVPVERVMTPDPVTVDAAARVGDVVEEHFLRRSYSAYPVVRGSEVVGLVTLDDVSGVPADRRDATPVSAVMSPVEEVPTVEPGETLDEVLSRVSAADLNRVLVVEGDTLVGLVTMGEIAGWLERARKLGLEEGEVPPPADDGGDVVAGTGRDGTARRPGRER